MSLIEFPGGIGHTCEGVVEVLERVLAEAKEGRLSQIVMTFHSDSLDESGRTLEHGEGGQLLWDRQGRVDAIHSSAHILALCAAQNCIE